MGANGMQLVNLKIHSPEAHLFLLFVCFNGFNSPCARHGQNIGQVSTHALRAYKNTFMSMCTTRCCTGDSHAQECRQQTPTG